MAGNLNPGQQRKWAEKIEEYLGCDPAELIVISNPPTIPDEADVDWRVWYPLDVDYTPDFETEPEAYYLVAEWLNTWDFPW